MNKKINKLIGANMVLISEILISATRSVRGISRTAQASIDAPLKTHLSASIFAEFGIWTACYAVIRMKTQAF